ncbi:AMP-dependent synthetase/ligase [Faecalicatena orotica]|uniref:AMP-dependent synthetase/ligase n=1 Tax=Faecalicatena orotica TaxID=1544 RepID=UPI0032171EDD
MKMETMKDIIRYAADTYGENPAIRYKVRKEVVSKTYQDLKKDSESFSRVLESLEMQGKHVAVIGPTTYEWIISYFGTANSGSVIVPLDAQLKTEDVCELLNRADISVLVFDSLRKDVAAKAKEACPGVKYMISMQAEESKEDILSLHQLLDEHEGSFECELDPEKMCAVLFTSGTTGKSKGVMLSHRNLTDNAVCLDMKIPAGTVSMTLLPIHHAYCFTMDILKGIYIGLVICINDSIMHVSKNMKLFKPEIVLLVPMVIESVYKKLKESTGILPKKMVAKAAFGGNLKTICSGGAYLPPEMVQAFAEYGITVLQGYGMTECSPVISTNLAWDSRTGSVGKLLPNCEAKTVDGEIWVRGSSVMLGYYKMPEETEEALTDGWLRTGDLGYIDEDSFVYITGRKKNLIILKNGENVSPEELENEIGKDPLVQEIIVREKESVIEAEIYPDMEYAQKKRIKDVPARLQEVIDDYNRGLPPYKKIHGLTIREEEFEKTPSRKIKRQ